MNVSIDAVRIQHTFIFTVPYKKGEKSFPMKILVLYCTSKLDETEQFWVQNLTFTLDYNKTYIFLCHVPIKGLVEDMSV